MWYPPSRDRMPGRHHSPAWPTDATSQERHQRLSRWVRKVENMRWRRYAATAAQVEAAMDDAENDIRDCQHGCCGRPAPCINESCNFTCHADDPEQRTNE